MVSSWVRNENGVDGGWERNLESVFFEFSSFYLSSLELVTRSFTFYTIVVVRVSRSDERTTSWYFFSSKSIIVA